MLGYVRDSSEIYWENYHLLVFAIIKYLSKREMSLFGRFYRVMTFGESHSACTIIGNW